MKNTQAYNEFVQSLESKATGGLLFKRVDDQMIITDYDYNQLGAWDLAKGEAVVYRG